MVPASSSDSRNNIPVLRGVLFDFDGTLTKPGSLDFDAVRRALSCPPAHPILEFIQGLPSEAERRKALGMLDGFEKEAARRSRPNEGAEDLLRFLRACRLKTGIISRNSRASILCALENFADTRADDFAVILSRDDPCVPKPSPEGIRLAADRMGIPMSQLLVVGDFIFDIQAGYHAGSPTAYLSNGHADAATAGLADCAVDSLHELQEFIRLHIALPQGKLPNNLLAEFLGDLRTQSGPLLVPPGIGEDVAAIAMAGEEVLVLKSDPITFATDAIASYAVAVNANDIATCGALPRWLLTTLLFPPGTTAAEVRRVMAELHAVAVGQGMVICGGHTEITDAVRRPVAVVQAVGTVARDLLIEKKRMQSGDRVLLSKAIAIEGTCILARELPELLRERGVSEDVLERCRALLDSPGISVVKEARRAAGTGAVTAMHDLTEGGLATALEELSAAGGHRIRVFCDRIPMLEETRTICRLLAIDPLGLIASGSLLITCAPTAADEVMQAIREDGIGVACIGEVLEGGCGVEAISGENGSPAAWPRFAADEIARIFEQFAPRLFSADGKSRPDTGG